MSVAEWQAVIGLEVHVQLKTRTKLFCGDIVEYGAPPNTRVCPVCLGLPGALPVTNRAALRLAAAAAFGLDCEVHERSVFARKNYFYPDLPKGYQITQFEEPLATKGVVEIDVDGRPTLIRIRRIHVEEDAGKSLHDRFDGATAVDLNRAGVPLVEIVTEPDLRAPADARAFLNRLKQTLQYLDVSDCDMEKGSLRVDANVSIRPEGDSRLGTKTELKNMNSFSNVERAIGFEVERQIQARERGEPLHQETLLWDEVRSVARPMRSKEESHDYRYFPDPDLPPVLLDSTFLTGIRDALPERPAQRERRFVDSYGIPAYDAAVLCGERAIADYFEAVAAVAGESKAASNWVMTDVLAWVHQHATVARPFPVAPERLGELIRLTLDGTLSSNLARATFLEMSDTDRSAAEIVKERGWVQVSDEEQLAVWVESVLQRHPDETRRFREGETKLLGFFMGQVMQLSEGKADPRKVSALLRDRLAGAD